jgi:hypothetical protein
MTRFITGTDRGQSTLLPECLDDWINESNPVRVTDAFVDALDLAALGFDGVEPAATGRPAYHPSILLKLYIYGYRAPCGAGGDDDVVLTPQLADLLTGGCNAAPLPGERQAEGGRKA